MSQAQSTRCPHCNTAFRVTPEQLAVARGSVRCGSCLEVFNAREHMLTEERTDFAPLSSRSDNWSDPGLPRRSRTPKSSATGNAQSSARPSQPPPNEISESPSALAPQEPSPFNQAPEAPESAPTFTEDDENDDFLFSVDDDDIVFMDDDDEEEATEPNQGADAAETMEFSDTFLSLDETKAPDGPGKAEPTSDDQTANSAAADDSWALDMLADLEQEEAARQPHSHEQMALAEPASTAVTDNPQTGSKRPPRSTIASERERDQLEAAFSDYELDEWKADYADAGNTPRRWWLAGSLLTLILVGQLFWWERETLSQQPALRGLYVATCDLLGCSLPDAAPDAGAIRALSSVLRPLPDGRMQLDAVFVNRSDRSSPFPTLHLEVQDFQGTVTADGLFLPEDYIGGEVRPGDMMPPGRPVSISINMNRPVEELNNFRLTFHY